MKNETTSDNQTSQAGSQATAPENAPTSSAASEGASSTTANTTEQPGQYDIVDASYVIENPEGATIVDVRMPQEYAEGHIPGAINIAYTTTPCTADEIASDMSGKFQQAGIGKDDPVIVYCRSGKRAKGMADALEKAGYKNVRIYEGSWLDWTSDPSRPVER